MDRRLQTPDSGSNYNFQNKMTMGSTPRSLFDLSHLLTTTIPDVGSVIPIALFETLPNDSFELSVEALLRVLPQTIPLYSRQRLSIHAFWSRMGDLHNEFNTFMTKGYTGDQIITLPRLGANNCANRTAASYTDLISMFIPAFGSYVLNSTFFSNVYVNALPFMMYTRIWRDYYMNKNFYINDRVLLPNVDDHFRLNTAGMLISAADVGATTWDITKLRYRDYADDYFTSAFPSPQRGTAPTLDVSLSQVKNLFNMENLVGEDIGLLGSVAGGQSAAYISINPTVAAGTATSSLFSRPGTTGFNEDVIYAARETLVDILNAAVSPFDDISARTSITLNNIRELAVAQSELEKMAKTDGSYADFGLTFFGRQSKNALDYRPVYVGGTMQSINFSEVLQTNNTVDTPLGAYAGHGISYSNNGYIGRLDCDDYGYLMVVCSVIPDTYYSQGIDRLWFRSLQSEMFLPDRARLGMREILNKELYFANNATIDEDIFAYQNPYDEYRYAPNRISGKIADPANESFYAYTQSREFRSTPSFSQSFATMQGNVRSDYLVAPTEVPYTAQFSIKCRAVRPLPYHPIPSNLGM
ncbi:major capsid protein [Tortoise microvirus 95]|nr:major capsid protein [Tortoise microvirus 95]QCS37488.1 major capsid protein [Tortoise microvirus 109]